MTKVRARRFLLLVYFAVPLVLLGWVARFPAIPTGSASEYWAVACGSQPRQIPERLRYASRVGLYPEADGWLHYFAQEHHGQPIYRVDAERAAQSIPVLPEVSDRGECAGLEWPEEDWCEDSLTRQPLCFAALSEGRRDLANVIALHRRLVADLSREERALFSDRLDRARRRPAAIAFEGAFLLSWQLFLAWPWLRRLSAGRKALHLFASPLLLFVPFYLGYAPLTFTFGPSGGLLYPLYLLLVSLPLGFVPCTSVDRALLGVLPGALSPLSQLPGPPAAISFFACVGPVACLLGGAAASALYLVGVRTHAKLSELLSHARRAREGDGARAE